MDSSGGLWLAWGGQCRRGFDRRKRSGSEADGSDQCWVSVRMEDKAGQRRGSAT